jgi:hypothetical protein
MPSSPVVSVYDIQEAIEKAMAFCFEARIL